MKRRFRQKRLVNVLNQYIKGIVEKLISQTYQEVIILIPTLMSIYPTCSYLSCIYFHPISIQAMLWDLNDGKHLYTLYHPDSILYIHLFIQLAYLSYIYFHPISIQAMLWDLNDGKHLYTLDHADSINALCFSPNRQTRQPPYYTRQ